MAQIPLAVVDDLMTQTLQSGGLKLLHQGKVRDTWEIPGHSELLLVVASNRLSIFDIILPARVSQKGEVLTALSSFWFTTVLRDVAHHQVASGSHIVPYLPSSLRSIVALQKSAVIVRRLDMVPIECIVRGYLTGSGWRTYQASGEVCGHQLPPNLHDGSQLVEPLFTPTTKATDGHDENLSHEAVTARYGGGLRSVSLAVYDRLHTYAAQRGVILADTKFELGYLDGRLILGDEVGTPDSSRFWDREEWLLATSERRSPSGFDKEPVRQWGIRVTTPFGKGVNHLEPNDSEHLDWVHNRMQIPPAVLRQTTQRYRTIFGRLTGMELEEYQRHLMAIRK